MTITKQTALNEILVRLKDDGSVGGAHVVEIEHLTDTSTGEILSSRLLPARGITEAEVGTILGAANAGLLEQIDRLNADLAAMTTDRDAEKAAKDTALSGKAAAEGQRDGEAAAKDTALAQIAALTTERDTALAEKAEAHTLAAQHQAEVATLTAEKAALVAEVATLTAEKAALVAEVASLTAQLHPVDAGGFAILSAVQVRLALLGAGITFAMVDSVIEVMPEGVERDTARTYWEYAVQFERAHPFIAKFSQALGLSDAQVDGLWQAAASIQ